MIIDDFCKSKNLKLGVDFRNQNHYLYNFAVKKQHAEK